MVVTQVHSSPLASGCQTTPRKLFLAQRPLCLVGASTDAAVHSLVDSAQFASRLRLNIYNLKREGGFVLDRLRARLNRYLLSIGYALSKAGLSPTSWTFVGLLFSLAAGVAFWSSGYRGELEGGLLILVSGFFDIVDGAVARATDSVSKRGAFLDSTLDRVAEVFIYSGILLGRYTSPILVLLALSLSLMVSYARAKADSLGVSLSGVGIGERSERLLALSLLSILGFAGFGVLVVVLLALVTFLQRLSKASGALR